MIKNGILCVADRRAYSTLQWLGCNAKVSIAWVVVSQAGGRGFESCCVSPDGSHTGRGHTVGIDQHIVGCIDIFGFGGSTSKFWLKNTNPAPRGPPPS